MDIKSIRLRNFKGFKDATLPLKPLTVLLGPNHAGKSCFGQALVALSKSNASKGTLSLKFDTTSSVEFGSYSDLVHVGSSDQPVMIELGLTSGKVVLAFGKENKPAGINDLDLESIKYDIFLKNTPIAELSASKDILAGELKRYNESGWTVNVANSVVHDYQLSFTGIIINSASEIPETVVSVHKAVPEFNELIARYIASFLKDISYLRPDRHKPERSHANNPSATASIDDWGDGTDSFIHKNRDSMVDVFFFPPPSSDKEKTQKILSEYSQYKTEEKKFLPALTEWLQKLGLAKFLDVKSFDGDRVVQLIATPIGQDDPRPLTDVGFGLSQVLPILAKGLSLEKDGLLVVEQPEAQLHPKPQEVLADFFCSMVKCTRNVIVETHSVELFHRLRLRAAMDDELADKIGVYFVHEPANGVCNEPIPISLNEEAELKWPEGFMPEGIQQEMEILSTRLAREKASK